MKNFFLLLLASVSSSVVAGSPIHQHVAATCAEELKSACVAVEHKGASCTSCIASHKATLVGCTAAEEAAFCKAAPPHPPAPPANKCKSELIAYCGKDAKGSACFACATAHKANLTKDGCTETIVNQFCEPPHPPPTPAEKCEREEELLCGNDRHNKTLCGKCITLHAAALKNASCTETQTRAFCEPRPPPAPSGECYKVLEEYCEPERKAHNHTACIHCVDAHENQTRAAHCTYTQIESFCSIPPPGPTPVNKCWPAMEKACELKKKESASACHACIEADADKLEKDDGCTSSMLREFCDPTPGPTLSCEKEFRALCGQEVRNKTQCIRCEDEHEAVLKKANCTVSALAELCHSSPAPGPPPPPHRPTCGEVLQRECGADQKNATLCKACIVNHAAVAKEYGCTPSEETAFCAHKPPPPPAPSDKCRSVMAEYCEVDRHNKTLCVGCLEKHHNQTVAAKCTYSEEAAFCEVTPPRPPAPPSPTEECERALYRLCSADRANKTKCTACETTNKAALAAAHCTAAVEERFCEAAPPRPPSPPSPTEECERELYHLCDADRANKTKCTACETTNKAALAAAHCTAAVEEKFCEAGPKPPPTPPANACLKVELEYCGKVRSNMKQCIECIKEHYNTTVAAHCTREEDATFCHITPGDEKCFRTLKETCGSTVKVSKAACTGCERAHANTTKAAGCTEKQEDAFCNVTAGLVF